MSRLAEHMKRAYLVFYFPKDYRPYLVTRKEPYVDVRHIVRTRLGELHDAGPTAVARAEAAISGKDAPKHGTIIHSRYMTNEVLPMAQPLLIKRIDRLIEVAGYGLQVGPET
jgi:hypothetical protein